MQPFFYKNVFMRFLAENDRTKCRYDSVLQEKQLHFIDGYDMVKATRRRCQKR